MARKSDAINYGNYHLVLNNIINISKLVQLLVEDSVLEKWLGQKFEIEILDLFAFRTI